MRQSIGQNRQPINPIPKWPGEGQIAIAGDGILECTWRASRHDVESVGGAELIPNATPFGNRVLVRIPHDHQNGRIAFAAEIEATPATMAAGSRHEFRTIFLIDGKPLRFKAEWDAPTPLEEAFEPDPTLIRDPAAARVLTLLESRLPCGSHPAVQLEIGWARLYESVLKSLTRLDLEGTSAPPASLISQALELLLTGHIDESVQLVATLWKLDAAGLMDSVVELSEWKDSGSLPLASQLLMNLVMLSSELTSRGQVQPCVTWGWRVEQRPLSLGTTALNVDASNVEAESFWYRLPDLWVCSNWHLFLDPSDIPASRSEIGDMLGALPASDDDEMDQLANAAFDEIDALSRWTVPPLARVFLDCGALVTVDLFQFSTYLIAIFRNPHNHFFVGQLDLSSRQLQLLLPNPIQFATEIRIIPGIDDDGPASQAIHSAVRLLLATIWRDFSVPDDRPFTSSRQSRVPSQGRSPSKFTRFVYLPKVLYTGTPKTKLALAQLKSEDGEFRLRSQVAGHLRRAKRPAASQLSLARMWGINVPPDHTFVRPHVRMSSHRERVYRSRSYLKLILDSASDVQSSDPDIWLDFEQSARRTLEDRGVDVCRTAVHLSGHLILYGTDRQRCTTVAIAAFDDPTPTSIVHDLSMEAQLVSAQTTYLIVQSQLDRVTQAETSRRGIRVVRLSRPSTQLAKL